METEYEIRPAAPVPDGKSGGDGGKPTPFTRALSAMEAGQSFIVPLNERPLRVLHGNVSNKLRSWAKRHGNGRKFATRREVDGIAVWRVK